jgi:hypothetical protein
MSQKLSPIIEYNQKTALRLLVIKFYLKGSSYEIVCEIISLNYSLGLN